MADIREKSQRGITLLEILIANCLMASAAMMVFTVWTRLTGDQSSYMSASEAELEMIRALNLVMRVGRIANNCQDWHYASLPPVLQCQVDFNLPPSGSTTPVFFTLVTGVGPDQHSHVTHNHFNFVKNGANVSGIVNGAVVSTFSHIGSFEICSDTDFLGSPPPVPSCNGPAWGPSTMNSVYAGPTQSFFRIRITPAMDGPGKGTALIGQTAFFPRNASGIGSFPYVMEYSRETP